jgi:hypothetical protein
MTVVEVVVVVVVAVKEEGNGFASVVVFPAKIQVLLVREGHCLRWTGTIALTYAHLLRFS